MNTRNLIFKKGFKHIILEEPIITDNTKEVRAFLGELGFDISPSSVNGSFITVSLHSVFWGCTSLDMSKEDQKKIVINNCIGDVDKFKRELKVKEVITY